MRGLKRDRVMQVSGLSGCENLVIESTVALSQCNCQVCLHSTH